MVESDTAQVSDLPMVETLLTLMDKRAQTVRAAPGVTPEGGSIEGVAVLELIEHLVMGKPLVGSLQERMPVMKPLEHAILATTSVWEPLEHLHCVMSDHVDFDSFWMAPWDAGGTLGVSCRPYVTFWRTLLRSVIRLSCRPAIVDEDDSRLVRSLGQIYVLDIHMGLTDVLTVGHYPDIDMKITTESPRLDATPGEWDASDRQATTSTGFPQKDATPGERCAIDLVMTTTTNVPRTDATPGSRCLAMRLQQFPGRTNPGVIGAVKLGCKTVRGFPQIDSAAVDRGTAELNELDFRRTSFPPDEFSAGRECDYICVADIRGGNRRNNSLGTVRSFIHIRGSGLPITTSPA